VRNASEIQSEIGGNPSDTESSSQDEARVVVRQLSPVDVPTYVEKVPMPDGDARLLVVERITRGTITDDEAAEYVRDAHAIVDLCHPNVVGATSIVLAHDEISVASDFVDGERLSDLWRTPDGETRPVMPLEIAMKIFIDVLHGLAAIHKLKSDNGDRRLRVIHGEVTAANIVVGVDGVVRLLRACRVRRPGALPSTGLGTLAPEILSGSHADQHADVFSVGALLWQALSGRPLVADDANLETVLQRFQSGEVPAANIPNEAPWAAPLVDVAARALDPAPDKRFPTATAMITELRRIAGTNLATTSQLADFVSVAAGERIARRRAPVESNEAKQTLEPQRLHPESGIRRLPEPMDSPDLPSSLDVTSSLDHATGSETPRSIELVGLKSAVPTLRPVAFVPEPEPAPQLPEPAHVDTPEPALPPSGIIELDPTDLKTSPPSMPNLETVATPPRIPSPPAVDGWNLADLLALTPPERTSRKKPTRRPWSEPPLELEPADMVSVPPSSPWQEFRLTEAAASAVAIARAHRVWLVAVGAVVLNATATWAALHVGRGRPAPVLARDVSTHEVRGPSTAPLPLPTGPDPTDVVAPAEPRNPSSVTAALPAPAPAKPKTDIANRPGTPKPPGSKLDPSAPNVKPTPIYREPPRVEPDPAPRAPAPPPPSFAHIDLSGEFDRNAAMQALRQAGDRARVCFVGVRTTASVRVAVTFARNGSATDAVVEGPLAGTPTGVCIASKFRSLHVPPFRGSSLTVHKTITF